MNATVVAQIPAAIALESVISRETHHVEINSKVVSHFLRVMDRNKDCDSWELAREIIFDFGKNNRITCEAERLFSEEIMKSWVAFNKLIGEWDDEMSLKDWFNLQSKAKRFDGRVFAKWRGRLEATAFRSFADCKAEAQRKFDKRSK